MRNKCLSLKRGKKENGSFEWCLAMHFSLFSMYFVAQLSNVNVLGRWIVVGVMKYGRWELKFVGSAVMNCDGWGCKFVQGIE